MSHSNLLLSNAIVGWFFVYVLITLSTVSAQVNVVNSVKTCYIPNEPFVINFVDADPKPLDWVGIVNGNADFTSMVTYIQYAYTCGTSNCNTLGPDKGTISLANIFPVGQYRAVLLRENSFVRSAISSIFTVAATCPPDNSPAPTQYSVSVVKTCYNIQEGVQVSFTAPTPQVGDQIGLIESSAPVVNVSSVFYPAVENTCGTFECRFAPKRGLVSIFTALPAGSYKAVYLQGTDLKALAVSGRFTFSATCGNSVLPGNQTSSPTNVPTKSPTRKPTTTTRKPTTRKPTRKPTTRKPTRAPVVRTAAPTDPPQGPPPTKKPRRRPTEPTPTVPVQQPTSKPVGKPTSSPTAPPSTGFNTFSISLDRTCYKQGTNLNVSWTVPDPKTSDLIGLVNSSFNVNSPNKVYPAVIFYCGRARCPNSNIPRVGNVVVFQNLRQLGEYKAVLLRGATLEAKAISQNFTITNTTCPGDPVYTISVSKSCYAPAESVIVTFTDDDAQTGDQIGLLGASIDVNGSPIDYPSVVYTCGTTTNCTSAAPTSGTVGVYQQFAAGQYKAVLLRGNFLVPLVVSSNFDVSTTCP